MSIAQRRDLLNGDGKPVVDLGKRMADNVLQALHDWMQEPSPRGMDQVFVQSAALQALSTLALAEQLQTLVTVLAPEEVEPESQSEIAGLRSELAKMDADNAGLLARLREVGL